MSRKKHEGFTLIELLLGIAIAAVILAIGSQFIRVSLNEFQGVSKEYAVQNGVRTSMNNINNVINESTAIFTVGQDKFDPVDTSKMTMNWSYIGLSPDKTKLINYVWVWKDIGKKEGFHKAVDITPSEWNIKDLKDKKIEYSVGFYKADHNVALSSSEEKNLRSKKMVRIFLEGIVQGTNTKFSLLSDIGAMNVNQILDSRKSASEPITALAYRISALDEPIVKMTQAADAAVVFVIDTSGSMRSGMDGEAVATADSRIEILKRTAKKFVNQLENAGTIDLYFVPFSTNSYDTDVFKNLQKYQKINNFYPYWFLNWGNYICNNIYDYSEVIRIGNGKQYDYRITNKDFWGKPIRWVWTLQAEDREGSIEAFYEKAIVDTTKPEEQKILKERLENLQKELALMETSLKNNTYNAINAQNACGHMINLLKQPFSLNNSLIGKVNAQGSNANEYMDRYLSAFGWTNFGAGVREGYKILDQSSKKLKFLVVLSDGIPTGFDVISYRPLTFRPKEDVPFATSFGNEQDALDFVRTVMSNSYGLNVKKVNDFFIKETFLIGFSALPADKSRLKDTILGYSEAGGGTEKTTYLDASNEISLGNAFSAVVAAIQDELWYFEGP